MARLTALIILFVLNIPSNILALYAALSLQKRSVPTPTLLGYGALAGVALTVFRALPGPFGMHVPLQAILLTVLIKHVSRGRWSMAVLGTLVTHLLNVIGEGLVGVPVMVSLGFSLAETLNNPLLTLAGGWMANTLTLLLCLYFFVQRRLGNRGPIE